MKIRKLFIVVIAICILAISQSAFATNITPLVVGIGDTRSGSIPLTQDLNTVTLSLTSSTDVDWYVWTNNSPFPKFVTGFLTNNETGKYQLANQNIILSNVTSLVFSPGNSFTSIYLPPGGQAFFRVGSTDSTDLSANYELIVHAWTAS